MTIERLVWDEWNLDHIAKHHMNPVKVRRALQCIKRVGITFKNRLLIESRMPDGSTIHMILSHEDRQGNHYESGTYYLITAFKKEKRYEKKDK